MVKAKIKCSSTHKTWLTIGMLAIIFTVLFAIFYPMTLGKEGLEKEGFVGEAVKVGKLGDKSTGKPGSETIGKNLGVGVDSTKKVMIEICDDGIDNNANGLTDCQEEACVFYQICSPNCYIYIKFGKLDLSKFNQSTLSGGEYPSYKSVKSFKYEFVNNDYSILESNACLKRMNLKYENSLSPIKNIILYGDNFNCLEIYNGMPVVSFNNYKSKPVYNILGYDLLNKKIVLTPGDQLKEKCPLVANLTKETVYSGWFFSWGFDDLNTLKKCLDEGIGSNLIKTDSISNGEIKHSLGTFSCPEEICSNQKDDDKDSKTDCKDEECAYYCNAPENCNNNIDDNGNNLIDCADFSTCEGKSCGDKLYQCTCAKGMVFGKTIGYATEVACNDQVDNDNDGGVDCSDSDCSLDDKYGYCAKKELCDNGKDDDDDSKADCDDNSDCLGKSCGAGCLCFHKNILGKWVGYSTETVCNDLLDNDHDGKFDCDDTECIGNVACLICTDTDNGKNYTTKGKVTDKYHAAGPAEDFCNKDNKTINEYYCNGNQYETVTNDCKSLFGGNAKCVDGACVYQKCIDTDYTYNPYKEGTNSTFNSNSLIKVGKTTGMLSSGSLLDTIDFCSSEGGVKVLEGYCLNDYTAKLDSFNCSSGTVCQKGACVKS